MTDARSTPQDDELPGMLAVAKGIAEQTFPHTMDAAVWAAEYVKLNPGADEGLMLSWFANAIMAGYDTAQARATRSESAPIPDEGYPGIAHDFETMRTGLAVMLSQALGADWFDDDPVKEKVVAWLATVKFPEKASIGDIIQAAISMREKPPGYRTGTRRLMFNKATKQIDVVTQSGFVVDSFDPPQEVA